MRTVKITPQSLKGRVLIPSSKSMGHREIICAALAAGQSKVSNVSISKDILATTEGMRSLGAKISYEEGTDKRAVFTIEGTAPHVVKDTLDCGESGSTLRFLLPLGAVDNQQVTFQGRGKLGCRPLEPYFKIFRQQGLQYTTGENSNFPLNITGPLQPGSFSLPGDVSSQFISGLLFALPLLKGDSQLTITTPLESQSYVALTLNALAKYGIKIEHADFRNYIIAGNQKYKPCTAKVEGDYSQAAFWLAAGTLGAGIQAEGLSQESLQGDKKIIEIMQAMGARLTIAADNITAQPANTIGTIIDAGDCPDIIPVLAVLAALSRGTTEIIHAGRLRIKECDRLKAMAAELNKIGGHVMEKPEGLVIEGVESFTGGRVDSWNDHRIAMSMAVASIKCREPLLIDGAEAVAKSYPGFWEDFAALGGKYE